MASSFATLFLGFGETFTALHVVIILVIIVIVKKLLSSRRRENEDRRYRPVEQELEPMKKRDFTLQELEEYDGTKNQRILIAVNGKVFDVTRASNFYGPEGPYGRFAGHDASRGLATFSLEQDVLKGEYDDLSDLNSMQMDSLREWEMQFMEKYDFVGKLLKPGETHQVYEDETEDEDTKTLKTE